MEPSRIDLHRAVSALSERGAHEIAHSGRTLLDHLAGTFNILREWQVDDEVALAGLYHSVYGGPRLPFQLFRLDERATVAGLIGTGAERIAFLYSRCEPRWWRLQDGGIVSIPIASDPATIDAIAHVSLANLKDIERSPLPLIVHSAQDERQNLEKWRTAWKMSEEPMPP